MDSDSGGAVINHAWRYGRSGKPERGTTGSEDRENRISHGESRLRKYCRYSQKYDETVRCPRRGPIIEVGLLSGQAEVKIKCLADSEARVNDKSWKSYKKGTDTDRNAERGPDFHQWRQDKRNDLPDF